MKTHILILLGLVFLTFSCKKADSENPVVSNVKVDGSSSIVDVSPGESISVTAQISDNEELSQFKIDIHHDFDGHSHKAMTVRFAEIRIENISGGSFDLSEQFTIPADASSGAYHGTIIAVDKEGNQSENSLFWFDIVRAEQPTINLNIPLSVSAGESFGITGDITGSVNLSAVYVKVTSESSGNTLYNQTFNIASSETMIWNPETDASISIAVPSGTTGNPKGVMLSHANIISTVLRCVDPIPGEIGSKVLSLLPMCHIYERR